MIITSFFRYSREPPNDLTQLSSYWMFIQLISSNLSKSGIWTFILIFTKEFEMEEEKSDQDEIVSKQEETVKPLSDDIVKTKDKSKIMSDLLRRRKKNVISFEKKKTKKQKPQMDLDNLFDDALDGKIKDFLTEIEEVKINQKGDKPVISSPIIDILKEQGYIQADISTETALLQVPEYGVLKIIIKEHPISLNRIQGMTDIETLSLVLSNLQADSLILQTNDYQWTISEKVKENLLEIVSSRGDVSRKADIELLRRKIDRESKFERQFISAMFRGGRIHSYDLSMDEMMKIPEFALLLVIKNLEPTDLENIQVALQAIPPVQVTRLLSKLEGEDVIVQDLDGQWTLSNKFVEFLLQGF